MFGWDIKAATQIEQGPLAYTLGNAKGIDQPIAVVMLTAVGGARFGAADEHAGYASRGKGRRQWLDAFLWHYISDFRSNRFVSY